MPKASEFTVVCFDVASDRRRRRLVRALETFGWRAQESVFEAWLDGEQRRRLERRIGAEIDSGEDRVAIYVLAPSDQADIVSLGRGLPVEDFQHAIV